MKNILVLIFIALTTSLQPIKAQEFKGIDKSPMDMAYLPDNFAHDQSPGEKAVARITYGRPQKKNRPVFGKMVPYGKIWRTGANEATEFIAYQPLTFGSKTLPAGTYTLFTIPEKDEWTLIFNTDVDIWGAYRYDSKKDVFRLNVKVKSTTEVVEAFAIKFETLNENEAALKLAWDQTKIEVPFSY
ncbi:MAG: hypothetical protein CBB92_09855 [Flammeovirgaceae bacterium TMED32]|nr:MAG: hypothetical protein CBB92_09855 [Flammeovirgaceae bacterium TMED32]|tara:strand:- start:208 stop:765 length:558 start_codon:yes stop_codon:yes gene_type:complete